MKQIEKVFFYNYFLNRITYLEEQYELVNRNMRVKSYKNCDEVDFLDLMIIKNELDYTIRIFNELKALLRL